MSHSQACKYATYILYCEYDRFRSNFCIAHGWMCDDFVVWYMLQGVVNIEKRIWNARDALRKEKESHVATKNVIGRAQGSNCTES